MATCLLTCRVTMRLMLVSEGGGHATQVPFTICSQIKYAWIISGTEWMDKVGFRTLDMAIVLISFYDLQSYPQH